MTAVVDFDDDLHDAWIDVERFGCGQFTKEDLATLLCIHPHRIWTHIRNGTIPPPAVQEEMPGHGRFRYYWTCAQATEALAARRRAQGGTLKPRQQRRRST